MSTPYGNEPRKQGECEFSGPRTSDRAGASTPKLRLAETLARAPARSPRRGGSAPRTGNFHPLWRGVNSWGLRSAATVLNTLVGGRLALPDRSAGRKATA